MDHRRIISVPVDNEAREALDIDQASPDQLVELALSESDFNYLFKEQVFEKINEVCEVLIGDFESEEISGMTNLLMLKTLLESIRSHDKHPLIKDLLSLVEKACEFKTSIHFFF